MKTNISNLSTTLFLPILLGLVAIAIIYAALNGRQLPFIGSPRAAIIALLVVGMAMCALGGIGPVSVRGDWAHIEAIFGYLTGAAILIVAGGALFGWKLPYVTDARTGLIAMTVLMGAKFVVGTLTTVIKLF